MSRYFCVLLLFAVALCGACAGHDAGSPVTNATTPTPAPPAAAPLPDPASLVKRLATQDGCKDMTAEMRLTGEAEDGKPVKIEFRVQRKYAPDRTATLLIVTAPREETDKALLAIERPGRPTEALSYLAGLKKIARFTSSATRDLRGAKIYIQELLGMELDQYTPAPPERVAEGGETLIKVSLAEKTDAGMAFPRIELFFRENDQRPARFELYDAQQKLARVVKVEEVKQVQNYQTVTKVEIEDKVNNRRVRLEALRVRYDQSLPDALFTEASLMKIISEASHRLIQ
ncbi:MAG TPA: outer membrane lipoprotein-sorting protein [Blastocatellia bacterium]|nr:outer membrane lipoprotein-sorting protein [Blastocatellia bacterium]